MKYRIGLLVLAVVCLWHVPGPVGAQDLVKEEEVPLDPKADFSRFLPRIPPKSPQEALKTFRTLPGFEVQLVACEPQVVDPVAVDFDYRGRVYVVCMVGYSEQGQEHLGQVRRLEDRDGDGFYETSVVFAAGLSWPTAVLCYGPGVFVGAAPDVWYMEDTDGDGRADVRVKVLTGFSRANVQGLLNSFRWGLDNRLHGATGTSGGLVRAVFGPQESKPLNLRGRDFAYEPRTHRLEATSGGAQHGMCFDDWGRKFVCSNSNHIQMIFYELRYAARNPYLAPPSPRASIAADGPQAEVFRISPVEPWRVVRTKLRRTGLVPGPVEGGGRPAGYFTSATGITIYRGDAWDSTYRGQAFVGDVGSNIVHRKVLQPQGVGFRAYRVDKQREFLASTDIWFRPVQFANAPDGCLWVLDMYREVIEHPLSLPPMIKKHLDLTAGRDRGRIWRIAPVGYRPRPVPDFSRLPLPQVVALLAHPNAWHRTQAAIRIYRRQPKEAVPLLEKLLAESDSPLGRLHALYALEGLKALRAEHLRRGLEDPHPGVREHAVRLAEKLLPRDESLLRRVSALADDPHVRVRYQVAFSLGYAPRPQRWAPLARLVQSDGQDRYFQVAILSSVERFPGEFLAHLAQTYPQTLFTHPKLRAVAVELTREVGRSGDAAQLRVVLDAVLALEKQPLLQGQVLVQLARGLGLQGSRLADRLAKAHPQGGKLLQRLIGQALDRASDEQSPAAQRARWISLLQLSGYEQVGNAVAGWLDPREPQAVQRAALEVLGSFNHAEVPRQILSRWKTLSPALRKRAVELFFARSAWLQTLLERGVAQGTVRPGELTVAQWQLLLRHPQAAVRKAAQKLYSKAQGTRAQVVAKYRQALQLKGDAQRGRELFRKHCSACHRLEGHGHELGPNLAAMKNRGPEAILVNVLDPNREVNPEFVNYLVVTDDGRTHTGMIRGESATGITLVREEGKQVTLLRSRIEVMQSTGMSLMPEGLEKQLSVKDMADLLAYLMQAK